MRQGQQNRRGRGRNNGHGHGHGHGHNRRGGQNPLTRSFESTGPDTKIRGTPAHIAEKYMALARDAHSAGDPVLAENYLQHAEHYNRIIMAYREQMQQSGDYSGPQPAIARFRPGPQDPMGGEELGEGEGDDFSNGEQPQPVVRGSDPQPSVYDAPREGQSRDGQPREGQSREMQSREGFREGQRYDDRGPRHENQGRHQSNQGRDRYGSERGFNSDRRSDRPSYDRQDRERSDRDRPERDRQDRAPDRQQDRTERTDRAERTDRTEQRERSDRVERSAAPQDAPPEVASQPRRSSSSQSRSGGPPQAHEQPEFLRRPVRRTRREDDSAESATPAPAAATPSREE